MKRIATMPSSALIAGLLAATALAAPQESVAPLPSGWTVESTYRELQEERATRLADLRRYICRGLFPRNVDFPRERTPYFVDHRGTECAVGYLMSRSGARATVAAIAAADNHVRVRDVSSGPLLEWVASSGLTREECARIQPTYRFFAPGLMVERAAREEHKRIRDHLLKVERELRRDERASLALALTRMLEKKIEAGQIDYGHMPGLIRSLSSDDTAVRIGAAYVLSRLPWTAKKFSPLDPGPALIRNLTHEDETLRLYAAIALLLHEKRFTDVGDSRAVLTELLKNGKSAFVRRRAVLELSRGVPMAGDPGHEGAGHAPGAQRTMDAFYLSLDAEDAELARLAGVGLLAIRCNYDPRLADLMHLLARSPGGLEAERDKKKSDLRLSPLHLAVARGGERVDALLAKGADVNAVNAMRRTPLHIASSRGDFALVEKLLARCRDLDSTDIFGRSALHWAAFHGHEKIVALLIERGAKVDGKVMPARGIGRIYYRPCTPLRLAVRRGHAGVVRQLLTAGCDPSPSLATAVAHGHLEITKALVGKGAQIEQQLDWGGRRGSTPLHVAAYEGELEVARFLLDRGAKLEAADRFRGRALHLAATRRSPAVARLLLDRGAVLDCRDKRGWTPLLVSGAYGATATLELLLERGADVLVADRDGHTALSTSIYGKRHPSPALLDRIVASEDDARAMTQLNAALQKARKDGNTVAMQAVRRAIRLVKEKR